MKFTYLHVKYTITKILSFEKLKQSITLKNVYYFILQKLLMKLFHVQNHHGILGHLYQHQHQLFYH